MFGPTIDHGGHGNLKHTSAVCCVLASGELMTSVMVSSQVNDSVIERLKTEGFRRGVDLRLERRSKPSLSAALFQQYITIVTIPFINKSRTNDQFAGKSAIR
jgi:hypothetical protein